MVRVLVVEDSTVARRALVRILGADPDVEVVGEAADGARAVALAAELRPDVITMDIHMPVMDGLEATRLIMERTPTPIVVVSTLVRRNDVGRSVDALQAGALTALERPGGPNGESFDHQVNALVEAVKVMAGVKVTPRPPRAQPPGSPARRERFVADRLPPRSQRIDVVAVAASTGGPAALASIAGSLPPDLSVPVLVVQHIREGFEAALVDLLDRVSRLTVRLASSGDAPTPGEILVAPPHAHLGFSRSGRVVLDHSAPIDGHRPSANFLFGSLARSHGARAMGVVLTGMGRDGAEGLSQLHAAGGWALAQDRSTSVVYGMPGAAVDGGAVDRVVPLQQMGDAIAEAASWGRVPVG